MNSLNRLILEGLIRLSEPEYPIISVDIAKNKVSNSDYKTIGKYNDDDELEIYLCKNTGELVALIDFDFSKRPGTTCLTTNNHGEQL